MNMFVSRSADSILYTGELLHGLFDGHALGHGGGALGVGGLDLLHLCARQSITPFMAIRVAAQASMGITQNMTITATLMPPE